jgi:hypothetical protein
MLDFKLNFDSAPFLATTYNDDNWSTAATIGENVDPLALIRYEVRRWRRGNYLLLYDDDGNQDKVASLDAR